MKTISNRYVINEHHHHDECNATKKAAPTSVHGSTRKKRELKIPAFHFDARHEKGFSPSVSYMHKCN